MVWNQLMSFWPRSDNHNSRQLPSDLSPDELQRIIRSLESTQSELQSSNYELRWRLTQSEDQVRQLHGQLEQQYKRLQSLLQGESREKQAAQSEVNGLRQLKHLLEDKVDSLEKQIAAESFGGSYSDSSATPTSFESALSQANEAVQDFSSALASQLSPSQFTKVNVFARNLHWKFALRSWLISVLFSNFESESFGLGKSTDVFDSRRFRNGCFESYKRLQEQAAVGDSKLLAFVEKKSRLINANAGKVLEDSEGKVDESLKQKLDKMLICMWKLHKLAFSFYPAARIVRAERGMNMDAEFMESVISREDVDEDQFMIGETIAFMVFPGFNIRKLVFKCHVYPALSRKQVVSDHPTDEPPSRETDHDHSSNVEIHDQEHRTTTLDDEVKMDHAVDENEVKMDRSRG